ncbi:hypothetical protein [Legionella bononiensis]|uniref:Uncharacterized protein n=1 Tax=Legionella bononiensis TaxID=2793102 RepID=A0ABS1WCN6_9GAMM|nr:hypothetical protein [Legionella bononiensis]MBL7527123.1 hypothetical protein [Legionella bononiensis]MBL7562092.1 hypothetical protein [Legionella bononiensis]
MAQESFSCRIQEIPRFTRDDGLLFVIPNKFVILNMFVILNVVKDLHEVAQESFPCHIQEIPRFTRDDG